MPRRRGGGRAALGFGIPEESEGYGGDPDPPAHYVQEYELPAGKLIAAQGKAYEIARLIREIGDDLTAEIKLMEAFPASQTGQVRGYVRQIFAAQDAGYPIIGAVYNLIAALDKAGKERP